MIMKKIKYLAMGIIAAVLLIAAIPNPKEPSLSNSGIVFQKGSWQEIVDSARKSNKPIFVDLSASWCKYCKKMKAEVYTDNSVASYYNQNFINVSYDIEKGDGVELAKKYNVKGLPTLVFIKADGTLISQNEGYITQEKLLELGKSLIDKK
jgi:thiol:disulfide interchange protein